VGTKQHWQLLKQTLRTRQHWKLLKQTLETIQHWQLLKQTLGTRQHWQFWPNTNKYLIEINFQTAHAPTFSTGLSSGHRDALRNLTLDAFSFS